MSFFLMPAPIASRRQFLAHSGLVLSGAAVALLAGKDALATTSGHARSGDVIILNTALSAELEAIAAYQLGAESNLLQKTRAGTGFDISRAPQATRRGARQHD